MIRLIISVVIAFLITFIPLLVRYALASIQDHNIKRKASELNKAEYDETMKSATHKADLNDTLKAARTDKRLWGLQRVVKEPLVDSNGVNVDKKGDPLPDGAKPIMVPEKDEDGNKVKEYIFDKWCTDYTNPNPRVGAKPLPIDPGKWVPSWPRVYRIGYLISFVLSLALSYFKLWPELIIPLILSIVVFQTMMKQGKACQDAFKATWDKLDVIYNKHFGSVPKGMTVKDMIDIEGWEAAGESQAIADATTYAAEIGKSKEAEAVMHPKNKAGKVIQPRIARFRDVPSKITFRFGTNFMKSGCKSFMEHMNQNIGGGTVEWLAMTKVTKHGKIIQQDSWDFDKQRVVLTTMPPLPNIASLPEDLDETPWNIIRLGRTVDGEATWDLSGQGWGPKMEKNKDGVLQPVIGPDGKPVADDMHHSNQAGITCPMSLVPLDINTEVWTIVRIDDDGNEISNSTDPVVLPAGSPGAVLSPDDVMLS